jgi:hypothetical protein
VSSAPPITGTLTGDVSAELREALELGHPGPPETAPAADSRRSLRAWAGAHRVSLLIVAVLCLLTTLIQAWGMSGWPARYDDEGTYVAQAWAVQHWGALGHYTYWYDHPPLGWLMLALLQWPAAVIGPASNAIATGRSAMLVIGAVDAALVYVLARRLGMRRGFAALALLIFTLCPLALNYHRMVWLDNLAMPWLLGSFVLALNPQRRLWTIAGSGACFALALLTKETVLLLLPALAMAVWQGTDRTTRRYALTVFGSTLVLICAFYPLMALVKNELLPGHGHVSLATGVEFQLFGRASSGSLFTPTSLSRKYLDQWLYLDAALLAGSALLAPLALVPVRLRPVAVALLLQVAVMLRPGYLPAPYVIAMLPFAALVVAGLADVAWRWGGGSRRRLVRLIGPAVATVAVGAAGAAVGPAWARMDHKEMTFNADGPLQQAQTWVYRHVPPKSSVLVDDTFWVDLVQRGFAPERVVWYYKLGTDPRVDQRYPTGWRGFDYVISSDVLRSGSTPQAHAAVLHSRIVALFGTGARRIEIRRVQP